MITMRLLKISYKNYGENKVHVFVFLFFFSLANISTRNMYSQLEYITPYGYVADITTWRKMFLSSFLIIDLVRTGGLLHPLNPLIYFYGLACIFKLSPHQMLWLIYIVSLTIGSFSVYLLTRFILTMLFNEENTLFVLVPSLFSGIHYMYSFYTFLVSLAPLNLLAYSLLPLSVLVLLKYLKYDKKVKWAIITSLLISIIYNLSVRSAVIISGIYVLTIITYYFKNQKNYKRAVLSSFKDLSYIGLLTLFLNAYNLIYWLGIVGLATRSSKVTPIVLETLKVRYILNPINVITNTFHYNFGKYLDLLLLGPHIRLFWAVLLANMVYGAIIFVRPYLRDDYILFPLMLLYISLNFLLFYKSLFYLFVLKLEMPVLPYLFSNPRTFIQLNQLIMAIFLAFFIANVLKRIKKYSYKTILCGIFLIVLLLGTPFIDFIKTGTVSINGYGDVSVPIEFSRARAYLRATTDISKIIVTPEYYGMYQPKWANGKSLWYFLEYYLESPAIYPRDPYLRYFYLYAVSLRHDSLIFRNPEVLALYLRILGVSHVVVHEDIHPFRVSIILQILNNSKSFKKIYGNKYIKIYKNQAFRNSPLNIPVKVVYTTEGYRFVEKLYNFIMSTNIKNTIIDNISIAVIYLTQNYKIDIISDSNNTIFSNILQVEDLYPIFLKSHPEWFIVPSIYAEKKDNSWSIGYRTDPHHAALGPFISKISDYDWNFDYNINYGFVFANGPEVLDIPLNIKKDGKYILLGRFLKHPKGGDVEIRINNLTTMVSTIDTRTRFTWIPICTVYLNKGRHSLEVKNVRGMNSINLFMLLPEDEYFKVKKEAEKLLENGILVYLFEAETDLYRENAEIIDNFNEDHNTICKGAIKFLENGKAWRHVKILKSSTYKIVLKGMGVFNVSIGNFSYVLASSSLTPRYTPMFYLKPGNYTLNIIPLTKNAILDAIGLYSTYNNEDLEELFRAKEEPAQIKCYIKANPTLWKIKINAIKPFMMTFSESYNPLWEARVYKNGKLVKKVPSVPVYGVINGFWINQTGELEIVLRYIPQEYFEHSLKISSMTFLSCIFYLVYDWRLSKEDTWAIRVNHKIKRLLRKLKRKALKRLYR